MSGCHLILKTFLFCCLSWKHTWGRGSLLCTLLSVGVTLSLSYLKGKGGHMMIPMGKGILSPNCGCMCPMVDKILVWVFIFFLSAERLCLIIVLVRDIQSLEPRQSPVFHTWAGTNNLLTTKRQSCKIRVALNKTNFFPFNFVFCMWVILERGWQEWLHHFRRWRKTIDQRWLHHSCHRREAIDEHIFKLVTCIIRW